MSSLGIIFDTFSTTLATKGTSFWSWQLRSDISSWSGFFGSG
jgi:hypothetical protein